MILDEKSPYESQIGLVWLDKDFLPLSEPQLLDTRKKTPHIPSHAEDGRLINCGTQVYLIYSNSTQEKPARGAFRVYFGEILYDGENFHLEKAEPLLNFEGECSFKREKNWIPFNYEGKLFLTYSISPHLVLHPLEKLNCCETISISPHKIHWPFGVLRGGTPALLDGEEYLSFFHSSIKMSSLHSKGKNTFHYFIGAYRFKKEPPFTITQISAQPIIGKNFYHGANYKPYWTPVQAIFPCGFFFDEDYIWIAYGRQDHECWIAKLDKRKLMKTLIDL